MFGGDGGSIISRKKFDANGSSAHNNMMSVMSLSTGDMGLDNNLSSVFDSSLRISGAESAGGDMLSPMPKKRSAAKQPDTSSTATSWEVSNPFDMSVNTIGDKFAEDKFAEAGNMSVATFGDPKLHESENNMSFSHVFEDGA